MEETQGVSSDQEQQADSTEGKKRRSPELELKEREVVAREREVAAKEEELRRSKWLNPTVLGLFAAALGLFGNMVVVWVNNRNSQQIEQMRSQSNLIFEGIKAESHERACAQLAFFVQLGLLEDPKGTIASCGQKPETIPFQPSSAQQALRIVDLYRRHYNEIPQTALMTIGNEELKISYFSSDRCLMIQRKSKGNVYANEWLCPSEDAVPPDKPH